MIDWLNTNIAYWHWIIFGLILSVCEIFAVSFVLLWFGVSAIIVGLLLWVIPMSFSFQVLIWIGLSMFNVYAWFKWVSPHFKTKTLSGMAHEKMIGQTGIVIEVNSVQQGRGKLRFPAPILGADEWLCICEQEIEIGSRVRVQEFSGNKLIVIKVN